MITSISDSHDLATVLNVEPLTEEDAAETPCDWIEGIWVAGKVYPLDATATTETLAVLANGTAAVEWSPEGKYCGGSHRTAVWSHSGHWCAADTDSITFGDEVRGVTRDWRQVTVWDSNGHVDREVYDTLDEAHAAYDRESDQMGKEWRDEHGNTEDESAIWSVVRGESPGARAVIPCAAGVGVPDDVLTWAEEHGLSSDDPDVYLLVTPRSQADDVLGEVAWREFPMGADDLSRLHVKLDADSNL
ncbi:hypothetical protein ACH4VR_36195 [Streptomyces sp. NPDC020883]|uniref:hypothetical protein n=1 Tax=Streptomyces sp. NPDC020883 TaxID=3365099 RepID=UPI0037BC0134